MQRRTLRNFEAYKRSFINRSNVLFQQTELSTDASPTGLGAVLAQKDPNYLSKRKIILYASRALSEVEKRYSQVERV